ncbi:MAG TPA: sigma-70 family RNA polymerase sigma factor [Chitinophaga sp.]|uniref:RNA polymerase sigma factor n=1 Tax=Chitinophaga sp. TaxID=1869181 RepID=UPI002C00AE39|nr:sigma-70 family RNA polymerase sigma factor [Chitinophaga sp.]HVI49168.1 sigma-70 family RNA polymerase sigma factor [Chitinophaga sp.]
MEYSATYTEAELIRGLRDHDQKIFSYLYDHYSPVFYGVIVRVLNNDNNVSDVLQDVFLKIWRYSDKYDENKGRLFTWMLNITRNTAIDMLRTKSHQPDLKSLHLTDETSTDSHLAVYPYIDHVGLAKVLESLTREQRLLIDLAYYKGCTREEIANILEIPLGTVKTRIRNTIQQLRNILNK